MKDSTVHGKIRQGGQRKMVHVKHKDRKLIIGIIVVSLMGQANTMLSPALAIFQAHFPDVPGTTVQALVTLPSLLSIPFFFVGGMLSRRVSTKTMLNIGLVLMSAGGLFPIFISDFTWILICRAVMGMGLGFVSPFSQSLISDNFEGKMITWLFGIQAAAISAGNMIGCFFSGYFAKIDYHASFLCYILGPAALAVSVFCVPKRSKHPAEPGKSAIGDYLHVPLDLWLRYLFQLVFAIVYFAYFNNASMLMAAKGIGDSSSAGLTTALSSLIGIAAGLLMPKLHQLMKSAMVPAMTGSMMLGMIAMVYADSILLVHVASFLIGFAYSVVMPFVVSDLTRAFPDMNHTVTSSLFVAANGIGASISAVVLEAVSGTFGMEGAAGQACVGIGLAAILTAGTVIYILIKRKHRPKIAETM